MNVDDHAIDALKTWYRMAIEQIYREAQEVESVKQLNELPTYETAIAYAKAINILVDACYLPEYRKEFRVSVSKSINQLGFKKR